MLQRRQFIQGAGASGLAPLAIVLASPQLAAQVAGSLETVTIEGAHGPITAALSPQPSSQRAAGRPLEPCLLDKGASERM